MLKTTRLTKALYDTPPIHLPTSSASSSSCDTEPSSICSSYKSHASTNDCTIALLERLKREVTTLRQAKSQLAILYKVSLNSRSPLVETKTTLSTGEMQI